MYVTFPSCSPPLLLTFKLIQFCIIWVSWIWIFLQCFIITPWHWINRRLVSPILMLDLIWHCNNTIMQYCTMYNQAWRVVVYRLLVLVHDMSENNESDVCLLFENSGTYVYQLLVYCLKEKWNNCLAPSFSHMFTIWPPYTCIYHLGSICSQSVYHYVYRMFSICISCVQQLFTICSTAAYHLYNSRSQGLIPTTDATSKIENDESFQTFWIP